MKAKLLIAGLVVALIASVYLNVKPNKAIWNISFGNANTRSTYDDYHHISEAQQLATGKGIKVGIIDRFFGYELNKSLYAGGEDFANNENSFGRIGEHGLWMAITLREIAPDVEIYALNCLGIDNEANAITAAIDWAIKNKIDILTYSGRAFLNENRPIIDEAVRKAVSHNMIVIFLHYDLTENILPFGFFSESKEGYKRTADVNIYHFDYNLLLLDTYVQYIKGNRNSTSGNSIPYFSLSSMAPVLAGIISMMRQQNPNLSSDNCKEILVRTSETLEHNGFTVNHIVNAKEAVRQSLDAVN